MAEHILEQLDFIYSPSADVAADLRDIERLPGARVVFAIDSMDTRVAMVELTTGAPRLLLAGHLEGERPFLVYRVANLDAAVAEVEGSGASDLHRLELPMGPACAFTTAGGHRFAVYQETRPGVVAHFGGRRDF